MADRKRLALVAAIMGSFADADESNEDYAGGQLVGQPLEVVRGQA